MANFLFFGSGIDNTIFVDKLLENNIKLTEYDFGNTINMPGYILKNIQQINDVELQDLDCIFIFYTSPNALIKNAIGGNIDTDFIMQCLEKWSTENIIFQDLSKNSKIKLVNFESLDFNMIINLFKYSEELFEHDNDDIVSHIVKKHPKLSDIYNDSNNLSCPFTTEWFLQQLRINDEAINHMTDNITKLEHYNNDYAKLNADLASELELRNMEINSINNDSVGLRVTIHELEQKIIDLEHYNNDYAKLNADLMSELELRNMEINSINNDSVGLSVTIHELEQKIIDLEHYNNDYAKLNVGLKFELEECNKNIDLKIIEYNNMKDKSIFLLEEKIKEIMLLENSYTTLEHKNAMYESNITSLGDKITELISVIDLKDEQIIALSNEFGKSVSDVNRLNEKLLISEKQSNEADKNATMAAAQIDIIKELILSNTNNDFIKFKE